MSYDVYIFPVPDGQDPRATAERMFESDECEDHKQATALGPAQKDLVAYLLKIFPGFESFEDKEEKYVELTHETSGMQIGIDAGHVGAVIPYWDKSASSAKEFTKIVNLIAEKMNYHVFDPQLGRVSRHLEAQSVAKIIKETISKLDEALAPRKWWQFWR